MATHVPTTKRRRPNLLVFFTDQQRADSASCYGQTNVINCPSTTPNLDQLAASGIRCNNAYTPNPVCGPARSALVSGRYPTATGVHINNIYLPEDTATTAKELSSAGYRCGYVGKWHLASSWASPYHIKAVPPSRRGGFADGWLAADALEFTSHGYGGFLFDESMKKHEFGKDTHRVDYMTDKFLEMMTNFSNNSGNEEEEEAAPWFLFLSFLEPHHQNDTNEYEPPNGLAGKFKDAELPGDLRALGGDSKKHYANYLACVHHLDHSLGRVLEHLDTLGLAEDTVVIFASDHGCHFRTRNAHYKRSCHDSSIRIPLVIRGLSNFTPGFVSHDLVSLTDVSATLLRAANIPIPPDWHGRPLQELNANNNTSNFQPWRSGHLAQISESQVGRMIRTARWTYSVRIPGSPWRFDSKGKQWRKLRDHPPPIGSESYVEDFLYDNDTDPNQLVNLVCKPELVDIRKMLGTMLSNEMERIGEIRPKIFPAPEPGPGINKEGAAAAAAAVLSKM